MGNPQPSAKSCRLTPGDDDDARSCSSSTQAITIQRRCPLVHHRDAPRFYQSTLALSKLMLLLLYRRSIFEMY